MMLYLRFRERVSGPHSAEQLRAMARDGQLSPLHLVSRDRQTWVHINNVHGLFDPPSTPMPASSPPPPPPAPDPLPVPPPRVRKPPHATYPTLTALRVFFGIILALVGLMILVEGSGRGASKLGFILIILGGKIAFS